MGSIFLLKIPGGGGGCFPGGAEWPGRCLRRIGEFGGGLNFFFFGAETSTKKSTSGQNFLVVYNSPPVFLGCLNLPDTNPMYRCGWC